MLLNVFKRVFKDALRTDQMIRGDAILQKSRVEQDEIIVRLIQEIIEILTNFQLITAHFGESIMDSVANTNFMVYLTNAYCLMKKIRIFWLGGCNSKQVRNNIEQCLHHGIKLTIEICSNVLQRGVISRINIHTTNYAMV